MASLEATVPFKLPREYVEVLGGPDSPLFTDTFPRLCTAAFRAARRHSETLLSLIELTSLNSGLPCFRGSPSAAVEGVRQRLALHLNERELQTFVEGLVTVSYSSAKTWAYDRFQYLSNGIAE